jgi:NhaP-type Na+/H+ or K+/H+ antiporter
VAVIQEFKVRGNLAKALYAAVGFNDGLAIVIFGFAFAVAHSLLLQANGDVSQPLWLLIATPLVEILLSFVVGGVTAVLYCLLARRLRHIRDVFIPTFCSVLITIGITQVLHLSWRARIGVLVITTITATSIIFEIGVPILCKIGLQKAGEIPNQ